MNHKGTFPCDIFLFKLELQKMFDVNKLSCEKT